MEDKSKNITIIVNTQEKPWDREEISYKEVVELAFGSYSAKQNALYLITFSDRDSGKDGSLVKGESQKVEKGMIFNVTRADKS